MYHGGGLRLFRACRSLFLDVVVARSKSPLRSFLQYKLLFVLSDTAPPKCAHGGGLQILMVILVYTAVTSVSMTIDGNLVFEWQSDC